MFSNKIQGNCNSFLYHSSVLYFQPVQLHPFEWAYSRSHNWLHTVRLNWRQEERLKWCLMIVNKVIVHRGTFSRHHLTIQKHTQTHRGGKWQTWIKNTNKVADKRPESGNCCSVSSQILLSKYNECILFPFGIHITQISWLLNLQLKCIGYSVHLCLYHILCCYLFHNVSFIHLTRWRFYQSIMKLMLLFSSMAILTGPDFKTGEHKCAGHFQQIF